MSDEHEWCQDVPRDEAVRAAEDAAAVPSIQHRDLPEIVSALRQRVDRLESLIPKSVSGSGEEACENKADTMQPGLIRAWNREDELAAERDAARAEVARLRARVAELERAYSAECDARAQAHRELSDLNDAIRDRESGEERDNSYGAQCREAAAARDRADRMIPAPDAGWDSNHASISGAGKSAESGTPEPRGWLTAEEREAVTKARKHFDKERGEECVFIARTLTAFLARESPPRVKVPKELQLVEARGVRIVYDAAAVKKAIRAAGGEVE